MPDRPPLEGIDAELLDRYLAGEGSEEENAAVRRYLMAHPETARELDALLQGLETGRESSRPPDAAASWQVVRDRMHGERNASPQPAAPPGAARPRTSGGHHFAPLAQHQRRPWWRRAAGGALATAAVITAIVATQLTRRPPPAEPPPPPRIYATANGEVATLRLIDGTRVRLAPSSRLRVSADFGTERRDVYLEGEAHFDVTHDEARPFTVFAGNASARDLGTEFVVRSYADDRAVQVAVREGIVALSGVGRLEAGDLGKLSAEGRATLRRGVNLDVFFGWLDGRLVFRNAPLIEVVRAIERWHDLEVQLSDPALGRLPFTGTLRDESPSASLQLVAATLALRVRRTGDRVTLDAIAGRTPTPP